MKTSFTKLKNGDWGIRVEGGTVKEGESVKVTKKNGQTDSVVVAKVLWSGNGVTLCAIEQKQGSGQSQKSSGRYHRDGGQRPNLSKYPRTGCSCGSREGYIQESDCFTCKHDAE